jgi:hypothetical protein
MSDCEDKPHTRGDRVFLRAADRQVKEKADTGQGYKKEKPAKRWQTSGGIVFVESDKYNGENGIYLTLNIQYRQEEKLHTCYERRKHHRCEDSYFSKGENANKG